MPVKLIAYASREDFARRICENVPNSTYTRFRLGAKMGESAQFVEYGYKSDLGDGLDLKRLQGELGMGIAKAPPVEQGKYKPSVMTLDAMAWHQKGLVMLKPILGRSEKEIDMGAWHSKHPSEYEVKYLHVAEGMVKD
jgi:hypothetical protein